MKQTLLILAVVMGQSVLAADKKPLITQPRIEKAVRERINKPTGELTTADLARVNKLFLAFKTLITNADLKEACAKLQQLTILNLAHTKITDAGFKEVAKLKQLRLFELRGSKITDAGLKEVAKCKQLRELGLHRTQITDAGLKEVAKLKQLRVLGLIGCTEVTKAGVAELQKALPKCKIDSNPTK